jgi:MFS family permease
MISGVGLTPAGASGLLIVAGTVGLAGFPLGARASDRLGRVTTIGACLSAIALAIAWSFWGPPAGARHPWLWVGGGFAVAAVAANALTVAANTAMNELFPPALRATMFGSLSLAGAIGRVAAQMLLAIGVQQLGSVSTAVGVLALVGLPAAAMIVWLVPETRAFSEDVVLAGDSTLGT